MTTVTAISGMITQEGLKRIAKKKLKNDPRRIGANPGLLRRNISEALGDVYESQKENKPREGSCSGYK